jgi:hypothetical protein
VKSKGTLLRQNLPFHSDYACAEYSSYFARSERRLHVRNDGRDTSGQDFALPHKSTTWGCKLPHTAAEDLLEIIMRRYERASTLLTSNRPVGDGSKLLEAPQSAADSLSQ